MCPEVRGKRTAPSTLVIRVSYQAVTFAQMIAKLTAAMADKTLNETRRCCTALAESEIRLWWWPRYVRA